MATTYITNFRSYGDAKITYTTSSDKSNYYISISKVSFTQFDSNAYDSPDSSINLSLSIKISGGSGSISGPSTANTSIDYPASGREVTLNTTITFARQQSSYTGYVTYEAAANGSKGTTTETFSIPALESYYVTYYPNGGSNAPGRQNKYYGITLTLTNEEPTRTYYTFKEWNTNSSGTGTSYRPGASYTGNGALNLYAIWTPHTWTVSYNANGGSGAPSSQTKVAGETLYLSTSVPTRNKHSFSEWRTNSDGTGTRYLPGDAYTENEGITLYAVWIAYTYQITYYANGGSGAPNPQHKTANDPITLSTIVPTRAYYTFKQWTTNSDGTGSRYQPGDTYSKDEAVDLYADWVEITYKVTYDANGGSGAPSSENVWVGESYTISRQTPTRSHYTFLNWYYEARANPRSYEYGYYSPGQTVNYFPGRGDTGNAYDVTLVATWSAERYTISYDANGGSGAPANQYKEYNGNAVTLSTSTPTRRYYTFKEWATNSSGSGTKYQPGASYTGNADLTLYAIWTPNEYTVSYNGNGGSNVPQDQTKVADVRLQLSTVIPTRAGYSFSFWNTRSDGTGTSYLTGSYFEGNYDLYLYAIWNPAIYYDANGGSGAPSPQIITSTSPITLSTLVPVRDNHTFLYWNTARNGTGTNYNPGDTYTPASATANVFLYAIWRRDPDNPSITYLLATRVNSSGTLDDEGTYLKVTCTWNVDTVRRENNTGRCYIYYKLSSATSWTTIYNKSDRYESHTDTATIGGINTDEQYDIRVRVVDLDSRNTNRYDVLTRAKFVWDVKAGGEAMGIGSAAPESGLEVGWVSQFDENVSMLENLAIAGTLSVIGSISAPNFSVSSYNSGIATANGYYTVSGQVAYKFGRLCTIAITIVPDRQYEYDQLNDILATLSLDFRPITDQTFGSYWGLGYINTQGKIYFRNYTEVSSSNQIIIGLTYITQTA